MSSRPVSETSVSPNAVTQVGEAGPDERRRHDRPVGGADRRQVTDRVPQRIETRRLPRLCEGPAADQQCRRRGGGQDERSHQNSSGVVMTVWTIAVAEVQPVTGSGDRCGVPFAVRPGPVVEADDTQKPGREEDEDRFMPRRTACPLACSQS
jgi:hypothetical protein